MSSTDNQSHSCLGGVPGLGEGRPGKLRVETGVGLKGRSNRIWKLGQETVASRWKEVTAQGTSGFKGYYQFRRSKGSYKE